MKSETKYVCPDCGVVTHSTVKLRYCVCGGKLMDEKDMMLKDFDFDKAFGDMFKEKK